MFKSIKLDTKTCGCLLLSACAHVNATERVLEANVSARAIYDDNIFVTALDHDSVIGMILTPSLSGVLKEEKWESELEAKLGLNKYSDHDLDSNDQYFTLTGRYREQRDILSLNVTHNFESNLSTSSTDFGIVTQRINRKTQSISPDYTYLLSERSALIFSYSYSDVDFIDAENTNFTPYVSQSGSATYVYDLSERNQINFNLQTVDYVSDVSSFGQQIEFNLLSGRVGIDSKLSEISSIDFSIGVTRRRTTNMITREVDFFGQTLIFKQSSESSDKGLVFDAGYQLDLEDGGFETRISRDETTNSYGGLDQTNRLTAEYRETINKLWRYRVNSRYEDITSIAGTVAANRTDREVVFLEFLATRTLTPDWVIQGSYRFVSREFKSASGQDSAPKSNRIYVSLRYNLPSLTTF